MRRTSLYLAGLLVVLLPVVAFGQTSETNAALKRALARYPEADANGDGILTLREARDYQQRTGAVSDRRPAAAADGGASTALGENRPAYEIELFKPTRTELEAALHANSAKNEPLAFDKGNGLRIVSSGHSWVGPALRTLPVISAAAGYDGQHIRSHTGGGGSGSANSIWRKEFGKYGDRPAQPTLLPAIATGKWDVMTWGAFYNDTPVHFSQWIDVCLKANPDMIFYLQDGWPRFDREMNEMEPAAALAKIDAMQRENQQGMFTRIYQSLEQKYPGKVHIMPAGAAVVDILHRYYAGELPSLDCVSENLGGTKGIYRDGGHMSRESGMEWIVGYVYYGMLYRRSPEPIEGLHPPDVDETLDRAMREAAWKAVTTSPLSGVKDADGDGVGDE